MSTTIENLQWRYATKQYDTTKKLSDEQRHIMIEALRLAPSSFGLQPWKFIHVTNPEIRATLKAAAWNQSPISDASDLFVLCSLINMDETHVDAFVKMTAEKRGVPVESLTAYRDMMVGSVKNRTEDDVREWNARQTYLALGVALAVAAENRIDATPMEGFDSKKFDEILGLEAQGLQSRVLLAVGFRSADDKYQTLQKIRMDQNDVVIEM